LLAKLIIRGVILLSLTGAKRQLIIEAILKEIKIKNQSPVSHISNAFSLSRQTVYKYLSILIDEGHVTVEKEGRTSKYYLARKDNSFYFKLNEKNLKKM
jgi:predicted transcriptional regulator